MFRWWFPIEYWVNNVFGLPFGFIKFISQGSFAIYKCRTCWIFHIFFFLHWIKWIGVLIAFRVILIKLSFYCCCCSLSQLNFTGEFFIFFIENYFIMWTYRLNTLKKQMMKLIEKPAKSMKLTKTAEVPASHSKFFIHFFSFDFR